MSRPVIETRQCLGRWHKVVLGIFLREDLATTLVSRYFRRGWRKEQYGSRGLDALSERTFPDFKLWKSYSLFTAMSCWWVVAFCQEIIPFASVYFRELPKIKLRGCGTGRPVMPVWSSQNWLCWVLPAHTRQSCKWGGRNVICISSEPEGLADVCSALTAPHPLLQ